MGFLAKLFGATSKEELSGLSLGSNAHWEVSPPSDFPSLLRALHHITLPDSVLYLEGGGKPPKEIASFLSERCVPEVTHIAMGTIWPRPQVFHLSATPENLDRLADLAEHCCALQVAVHFHMYTGNTMILEWYDAFCKDPMYLSEEIDEDDLRAFCSELSLEFKRFGENVEPSSRPVPK